MKNFYFTLALFISIIIGSGTANAWVYPEHREIMLFAVQKLSPEYRQQLDNLWVQARSHYEYRLTEQVIDPDQDLEPKLLDYASWPAIAGDHSCSAENMLHNILETEWILKVADVTARLRIALDSASNRDDRINALRDSDSRLQRVDPGYATRAGSNNAHFLTPLKSISINPDEYGYYCVKESTEINAIGVYIWYHFSALLKAGRLRTEALNDRERSELILSALADEAFAIHFLEDVFAAGHVAGSWGDASQRKGTHDYYNEKGLRTNTWNGEQIILTGDAWMRKKDAEKAAATIKLSIEELLDAASGTEEAQLNNDEAKTFSADTFNVCRTNYMMKRNYDKNIVPLLKKVLMNTPVPGLAHGLGELPRFRAELGMFGGVAGALRGSLIFGGFAPTEKSVGLTGGIEAGGRFGVGLDGVLNELGDGLVFLEIGWRQDGASTSGVINDPELTKYGNILAAIPGRSAFSVRMRLPFYLIPGDLLIASPFLLLFDQDALTSIGVIAVNGGLIPWQSGIATPIGRFQFVLGREIGVYLFGRTKGRDALYAISPDLSGVDNLYILSYRSTQLELPVLEYRPFRSFATDQSSGLLIQFYTGIDFPHNIEVLGSSTNDYTAPKLQKVWYVGARLNFNWRHYF